MSARRETPVGDDDARAARKAMGHAIRRLGALQAMLVTAAAVASVAGGWLLALLGRGAFGLTFRTTWVVASLVLFLVPGAAALVAEGRSRRAGEDQGSDER